MEQIKKSCADEKMLEFIYSNISYLEEARKNIISHPLDTNIDPNQSAKVTFIRKTGFQGGGIPFNIFMDAKIICKLKNNRYSTLEITPGKHEFLMQFRGENKEENTTGISQ